MSGSSGSIAFGSMSIFVISPPAVAVTGSSLRLAYELRDDIALAAGPAAPQISEEELVNRFVEEFDAEVLPEEEST